MNDKMKVKFLDLEQDISDMEDLVGLRGGTVYDDMREDLVEMRDAMENLKDDMDSAAAAENPS